MFAFIKKLNIKISRYRSLFEHNLEAVFRTDLKGNLLSVNSAAIDLTGFKKDELVGKHFSAFVHKGDVQIIHKSFNNALKGEKEIFEIRIVKKDGSLADVGITSVRIIVKDKIIGVYGIVKDMTEGKKAQETINYLAYHDELTTLPNRRLYTMRLHKLKQKQVPFTIMNIDFDRFKRLNDLFGHAFGDKVLIEIANRLKASLDESFFIARMGGDEFNVILPNVTEQEKVTRIANDIIQQFRKPLKVRGHDCLITASIGIAFFPEHSEDIDSLVKFADIAMYNVKQNGSDDFQVYDTDMNDKTIEKINMENDLRYALENDLLEVYYQPKYNSFTNELIGSEALLRWNHSEIGAISPVTFIKLAEETGFIIQIEKWVLRRVCQQINEWVNSGCFKGRVSINISHIHFYQGDITGTILNTLKEFNLDPTCLEIEITETTMMNNEFETNKILQKLRSIGIEISMDDFGTGYSSLGYLHKLSIDRLKIDKSFIHEMQKNEAIVATIISMANTLHLKVIAEGVETNDQIQVLHKLGCHEIQGYFYGKPLEAELFKQNYLESVS
ncbi:EAL domain-containing protein [Fredinandcohnia sp. 179-A 10B2 NHS]